MKQKDFKNWNVLKEKLHDDKINFRYRERDIFFMYVGANIGFEQDGDKNFLRPVLVYKKFNKHVFLGIPLTSQIKENRFHYEFEYTKGTRSFAILSQIRLFDIKRAKFRDGQISRENFFDLQDNLLKLIVTPLENPKGAHDGDL
jgi:mRNA interferase MazF